MTKRVLDKSPAMLGLFTRAGIGMIPVVSTLPVIGGTRASDVSDDVLVLENVTVERERLAAYAKVCGFALGQTLPATYPHMLAFPLHLQLMTEPTFPFPAIGMVHIYNKITVHRPLLASETFEIKVWAESLVPHPRGRAVTIISTVSVAEEVVWEEQSTNLRIGRSNDGAKAPSVESAAGLPVGAEWKLPADLGRRYAAVSGDYNPIHIHPLTAKLFGFPTAIAHGMWTKARCLAALESQLPDAYSVEVAFKRPVLLPATVSFLESAEKGGIGFGLQDAVKQTPHLDGKVSF
jgi:acyl dehydratase